MKNPWIIVLLTGLALALVSCKRDDRRFPIPEAAAATEAHPSAQALISTSVEKSVREKGQLIAAQAFGVLNSRLGKAIVDAGLINAVELCSVHGMTFTSDVGLTNDVVIRRVTHRPRNPQNRADSYENGLINKFQAELREGTTARAVVSAHRPGMFTYYAPIVLSQSLCLSCHGDPAKDIKPEVLAQIQKNYPADEATGFRQGEVRGLWSVDFKRSDFGGAANN